MSWDGGSALLGFACALACWGACTWAWRDWINDGGLLCGLAMDVLGDGRPRTLHEIRMAIQAKTRRRVGIGDMARALNRLGEQGFVQHEGYDKDAVWRRLAA